MAGFKAGLDLFPQDKALRLFITHSAQVNPTLHFIASFDQIASFMLRRPCARRSQVGPRALRQRNSSGVWPGNSSWLLWLAGLADRRRYLRVGISRRIFRRWLGGLSRLDRRNF